MTIDLSKKLDAAAAVIREEREGDCQAITDVTVAAFRNHPFSHQTEQFIVKALRAAGVMTVSLVAEIEGRVVGHVAFSPVTISDGSTGWYGVGPVSVLPELQRRGIGTKLMNEGLRRLKAMGAAGSALVGDPAYYVRFGFKNVPELRHEGVPQEVFVVLAFGECRARGDVKFHEGFWAEG